MIRLDLLQSGAHRCATMGSLILLCHRPTPSRLRTEMKYAGLVPLLINCVLLCGSAGAEESWIYPHSTGSSGGFRDVTMSNHKTEDSAEQVISWYAKRLALTDDHWLSIAAAKGFANLERGFLRKWERSRQKNSTTVIIDATPNYAHVTFVHRPNFDHEKEVVISISTTADGASIHSIHPAKREGKSE